MLQLYEHRYYSPSYIIYGDSSHPCLPFLRIPPNNYLRPLPYFVMATGPDDYINSRQKYAPSRGVM